jgi:predicted neuraminidase
MLEIKKQVLNGEYVFDKAPFASCHAATIAETDAGLICSWFAGTAEGHSDVSIWLSRQENGRWLPPVGVASGVVSKFHRYACWNPVLFQPEGEPLHLFYKIGPSPKTWWGMLITSDDNGITWSAPKRLPPHFFGPIKNKPVQLEDGTVICPSSAENHGWQAHFETMPGCGRPWTSTGPINDGKGIRAIQPSLLVHKGFHLQAIGRTQNGFLFSSHSYDNGRTWRPMELTTVPNPDSGTDAVTLANGRHLLIYNRTSTDRTPLNLAISNDGETWTDAAVLEHTVGEFSYPAIIQTSDNLVHIVYTWKRKKIKHVTLDPGLLTDSTVPEPSLTQREKVSRSNR